MRAVVPERQRKHARRRANRVDCHTWSNSSAIADFLPFFENWMCFLRVLDVLKREFSASIRWVMMGWVSPPNIAGKSSIRRRRTIARDRASKMKAVAIFLTRRTAVGLSRCTMV